LRAFAAGLRFAADLRAEALRAAVRRAGFRFAVFFRADALVAFFGLRDAAARFAFLGFLDLVAFAMIDLPVLLERLGIPCTMLSLIPDSVRAAKAPQPPIKTYQPIFLLHCCARKRRNH
jgi:hypothetical protein